MNAQVFQHRWPVEAAVRIAQPGVDGIAFRRQVQRLDRLTECAIGVAVLRSQFDKKSRSQQVHQEHPKGNVLMPRGRTGEARRLQEQRGVIPGVDPHFAVPTVRRSEPLRSRDWSLAEFGKGKDVFKVLAFARRSHDDILVGEVQRDAGVQGIVEYLHSERPALRKGIDAV